MKNQDIRAILDDVMSRNKSGLLQPEPVVDFARPADSPLHYYFEWNDSIAGEKYRLTQAETLIRSVYVTIEQPGKSATEVRAYVSLASDRVSGGGYRTITSVISDEDRKRELLKTAFAELENFRRKYEDLSDVLDPTFKAIGRVVKKLRKARPELSI